jgi:hypothetical protein
MAELVNRETARGAERAKDLMDSMMGCMRRSLRLRRVGWKWEKWFDILLKRINIRRARDFFVSGS